MPDREKVIKGLETCIEHDDCKDCSCETCIDPVDFVVCLMKDALALLKEQEAIVRCKDCKHIEHVYTLDELNGKKCYVCRKHAFTGLRDEDWFCADGERRTDDAGQR